MLLSRRVKVPVPGHEKKRVLNQKYRYLKNLTVPLFNSIFGVEMNILQSMFKSFSCSKAPRKSSLHAFTLVELFLTIAVVAVLAGMLMPALSGAREQARPASCMYNLWQMFMGIEFYISDFEGVMFPGTQFGPGNIRPWHHFKNYANVSSGAKMHPGPADYRANKALMGVRSCPSAEIKPWGPDYGKNSFLPAPASGLPSL